VLGREGESASTQRGGGRLLALKESVSIESRVDSKSLLVLRVEWGGATVRNQSARELLVLEEWETLALGVGKLLALGAMWNCWH